MAWRAGISALAAAALCGAAALWLARDWRVAAGGAGAAGLCALLKLALWDDQPIPAAQRAGPEWLARRPRRFFITGGASGVGRHLSLTLARQGHLVLAADVNAAGLAETVAQFSAGAGARPGGRLLTCALDVGSGEQWQRCLAVAVRELGGLDVLMNVAGLAIPGKTQDATERMIDLHLAVDLKGVMLGTSLGGKLMVEQVAREGGSCHIINFASMGAIAPCKGMSLYLGAKYGCRGYSLCAAKDLWGTGVFVSVVLPEAIQTAMLASQLATPGSWAGLAFGGPTLTVEDVERAIVDDVLPHRPRERIIATSWWRAHGARFSDIFSSSLMLNTVEELMLRRGLEFQARLLKAKSS
jgi:3-oxoacyl-[acyl-carrier protein] reductase